jgi:hypothetical protein
MKRRHYVVDPGIDGRPLKLFLKKQCEDVEWIPLAQRRV